MLAPMMMGIAARTVSTEEEQKKTMRQPARQGSHVPAKPQCGMNVQTAANYSRKEFLASIARGSGHTKQYTAVKTHGGEVNASAWALFLIVILGH